MNIGPLETQKISDTLEDAVLKQTNNEKTETKKGEQNT